MAEQEENMKRKRILLTAREKHVLNALTTYIVGSTSLKQLREHPAQENVDDNIYDKGDNVDDV